MRVLCKNVNGRWEGFIRVNCSEPNDLINSMEKWGIGILRPQIFSRISKYQPCQWVNEYPSSSVEKFIKFMLST